MDYSTFSLDHLYMLYEQYESMIKNYKDTLRTIEPNNGPKTELLMQQIARLEREFKILKTEIGKKYGGESDFSREWIFQKSYIQRKTLIFELRPGSESYNEFGRTLVGWAIYNEEEAKELLTNIAQNEPKNTNGQVKVELVMADLDANKLDKLKTVGIKTNDIQVVSGRF